MQGPKPAAPWPVLRQQWQRTQVPWGQVPAPARGTQFFMTGG